jgi:AhpD family alkylhydroperoxidase
MPIINTIEPEEAIGHLAEIYNQFQQMMGFIPNAFSLRSVSPELVAQQAAFLGYYWNHETLNGKMLAFIRLLVSEMEECEYCITTNTGILLQAGVSAEEIQIAKADVEKLPLEHKEIELIKFVLKVVKDSKSTTAKDMDHLRALGWTDKDILDATQHGTSQVASDMIFNAFKIEPDKF